MEIFHAVVLEVGIVWLKIVERTSKRATISKAGIS